MFGSHEFTSKRRLHTRGFTTLDNLLAEMLKSFALGEEYKLTQYCLKPFLTLSCSYLRVNFA